MRGGGSAERRLMIQLGAFVSESSIIASQPAPTLHGVRQNHRFSVAAPPSYGHSGARRKPRHAREHQFPQRWVQWIARQCQVTHTATGGLSPFELASACGTMEKNVGISFNLFNHSYFSSSYLVDPASSHMLVSKIKPCMSKYKRYTVKLRMAH